MLLYNIIYDPYHTLLRMGTLCSCLNSDRIEIDRLKMYDFLLAFPDHIAKSRLPRELQKLKKTFKKQPSNYSKYNAKQCFNNMIPIQDSVLSYLEKTEIIRKIENENIYEIIKENISPNLDSIFKNSVSINFEVITVVNDYLNNISVYGLNGLKDRLNLMEYKYDAI